MKSFRKKERKNDLIPMKSLALPANLQATARAEGHSEQYCRKASSKILTSGNTMGRRVIAPHFINKK